MSRKIEPEVTTSTGASAAPSAEQKASVVLSIQEKKYVSLTRVIYREYDNIYYPTFLVASLEDARRAIEPTRLKILANLAGSKQNYEICETKIYPVRNGMVEVAENFLANCDPFRPFDDWAAIEFLDTVAFMQSDVVVEVMFPEKQFKFPKQHPLAPASAPAASDAKSTAVAVRAETVATLSITNTTGTPVPTAAPSAAAGSGADKTSLKNDSDKMPPSLDTAPEPDGGINDDDDDDASAAVAPKN